MNRMTDERLAELDRIVFPAKVNIAYDLVSELLQALKAERKSLNDCARDNTKFRQRISELEAKHDVLKSKTAALVAAYFEGRLVSTMMVDLRALLEEALNND